MPGNEVGKEEFVKKLLNEMKDFKSHSLTVKGQYAAVPTLKDKMPIEHDGPLQLAVRPR